MSLYKRPYHFGQIWRSSYMHQSYSLWNQSNISSCLSTFWIFMFDKIVKQNSFKFGSCTFASIIQTRPSHLILLLPNPHCSNVWKTNSQLLEARRSLSFIDPTRSWHVDCENGEISFSSSSFNAVGTCCINMNQLKRTKAMRVARRPPLYPSRRRRVQRRGAGRR